MTLESLNQIIIDYNLNPTCCKQCNNKIDYSKKDNIFCDKTCRKLFNDSNIVKWQCIGCGHEHSSKKHRIKNFCNQRCHKNHLSNEKIKNWLTTGVFNSSCTADWMKNYILREQDNKCAHCSIDKWNNAPIVFDLEHIDGNSSNNNRLNLCCLCPNCHSQTLTYKGKNKGNGRKSIKSVSTNFAEVA